jgi:hypothetical protein
MAKTQGIAKLIAKGEMLCVQFEPPLENATDFHDRAAGYPYTQTIKHSGKVRWLVYNRGVFGWGSLEQEDGFIDYCDERAGNIGYEVVNKLLYTSEPVPVVDEV